MFVLSACGGSALPARPPRARVDTHAQAIQDYQAAGAAYADERYPECAKLYVRASTASAGRARAGALYGAGLCELRAGQRAEARSDFRKALEAHLSYCDRIIDEPTSLSALGDDPDWADIVTAFKPVCAGYASLGNAEVRRMFLEDQEDRKPGPNAIDWSYVRPRDIARRERLKQLEARGELRTADDFYYAAMLMQHGDDETSFDAAFRLASRAVALDATFERARWLAAASKDRYYMSRTEPQLYGTQYTQVQGRWILWPVDHHVTDRDRAEWYVDSLATAKKRVTRMNAR